MPVYGPARPVGTSASQRDIEIANQWNRSQGYGSTNAYQIPKPQVLGINSGGGVPSVGAQIPNNQQAYSNINQQVDNGFAQIDADYENIMGQLSGQEQGLRSQASFGEAQITNDASKARTTLGENLYGQQQATNNYLSTGEKTYNSSMQQARDLFRQTQQSNIAQLSALGISSSSVSEALAERLGVETARRIASNTNSVSEIRTNAANELGRIQKHYDDKVSQLDEDVRIQKGQIQSALVQGLDQINRSRQSAARDKAASRANLLSQAQNYIFQLTQQEQQFRQELERWAVQKSSALTPLAKGDFENVFNTQVGKLQQTFSPTQFNQAVTQNIDKYGQVTGSIRVSPKTAEDDETENNNWWE